MKLKFDKKLLFRAFAVIVLSFLVISFTLALNNYIMAKVLANPGGHIFSFYKPQGGFLGSSPEVYSAYDFLRGQISANNFSTLGDTAGYGSYNSSSGINLDFNSGGINPSSGFQDSFAVQHNPALSAAPANHNFVIGSEAASAPNTNIGSNSLGSPGNLGSQTPPATPPSPNAPPTPPNSPSSPFHSTHGVPRIATYPTPPSEDFFEPAETKEELFTNDYNSRTLALQSPTPEPSLLIAGFFSMIFAFFFKRNNKPKIL